MSLFWYPDINEKYMFEGKPDKGILLSSYINYFLSRLQSMFTYEGLPDTVPQKWLENLLLVNGSCVWLKTEQDGLFVNRAAPGGERDVYYIPTEVIAVNPWAKGKLKEKYIRDVDCVVMVNDTYAQGILPLLKKYCSMLVENEISLNIACIMSRGTSVLSAADDNTKASAELWLKRLQDGNLGIIGEAPFLIGNQDRALTVNQLSNVDGTITNLIEYEQYLKASLYNELGLQSNYNMKRESINAGESQLNEDMLHPLIDDMLRERQIALEKVNAMFGTNITVKFNSAWEINEREEEAAIDQIEATAEATEAEAEQIEDTAGEVTEVFIDDSEEDNTDVEFEEDETEVDGTEGNETEETPEVEVTISENAIEEIAEAVAEKLEESEGEEDDSRDENS